MIALEKYDIKNLDLRNRIVMAPMCMYSADEKGHVNNFHVNHYGSRALGGTGLIIVEATAVTPNGRISSNDLGIWSDDHIKGLASLAKEVHGYDGKIGIQLAHAGRKSRSNDEFIVAPSSIALDENSRTPVELSKEDIQSIVANFRDASIRADKAGFDLIEVHGAHGYLIHEFLSPITNKRTDEYGGSLKNRVRFLKEILVAVSEVWPKDKPIFLRVSADDYDSEGIDKYMMADIVNEVKDYIDVLHVSTGGLVTRKIDLYPGYQITHSEYLREKCNIPTIAVGLITEEDQIEEIIKNNRADMVALGRELLRNPYFVNNIAIRHGINFNPKQYKEAYK